MGVPVASVFTIEVEKAFEEFAVKATTENGGTGYYDACAVMRYRVLFPGWAGQSFASREEALAAVAGYVRGRRDQR